MCLLGVRSACKSRSSEAGELEGSPGLCPESGAGEEGEEGRGGEAGRATSDGEDSRRLLCARKLVQSW